MGSYYVSFQQNICLAKVPLDLFPGNPQRHFMVAEQTQSNGGPNTCKRDFVPERRRNLLRHPGERRLGNLFKNDTEDLGEGVLFPRL